MVTSFSQIRTASYNFMSSASSGGRTFIPVEPNQFLYSQFQYVAGVPAIGGQQGVPIDKLKILNTLIEHLVSMKQQNIHAPVKKTGEISDSQINTLIKQYQDQIRTVTAAAEHLAYKPPMPQTGAVINLVA